MKNHLDEFGCFKRVNQIEKQRLKILVVDDEPSIHRILKTCLSISGYEVVTAADGIEALDIFHDEVPALVVLDVMLPKLDGYRVCQKLRQQSGIPIIMLTALGDVADRLMGLEIGADDYVSKPFSLKELEARIRSLLLVSRCGRTVSRSEILEQVWG